LHAPWLADTQIDYNCAGMSLGPMFRPTPDSVPGKPFLKADEDMRIQWRALFDSWGPRPKIGLAWSGGGRHTGIKRREIGLETLRPLIEAVDADWVSLQYKNPKREIAQSGLPVRHYSRAVQAEDYDETAGLVAELDLVIGVNTSVHHLAGGLGVPSIVLVPEHPLWLYARDRVEFYNAWTLFKQRGSWDKTIRRLIESGLLETHGLAVREMAC
jgi:ADP-heptose:LPS heptosyltransferase